MIKKALILTLITMLGACSNGEDTSRTSAVSSSKNSQNKNINKSTFAQQDAGLTNAQSNDSGTPDELVTWEEEVSEEDQYEAEDEYANEDDYESEPEFDNKITVQQSTDGLVEWQTPESLTNSAAELVIVTPSGERITRKFAPGQSMALDESLPDGLYKWESVVTPELDPYVKEAMQSARESGDLQAQREMTKKFRAQGAMPSKQELKDNRQSGAFVVRDGIATPTTAETSGQDERG